MNKIIESISIENYRGFKEKQVIELTDNKNITFLVGQNNAGKSLIARILSIINKIKTSSSNLGDLLNDYDYHNLSIESPIKIEIKFNENFISKLANTLSIWFYNSESYVEFMNKNKLLYIFNKINGTVYCNCLFIENTNSYKSRYTTNELIEYTYNEQFGNNLIKRDRIVNQVLQIITTTLLEELHSFFLVFSPIRSLNLNDNNTMTGKGILGWLEDAKNASEVTKVKRKVGEYLKRLNLEEPSAVKAEKDLLSFTFKDHLKLTTEDVGTGYTMIYILLIEIMRNEKKIVVIDEIECHLQPGLIREIIKIIREIGNEQYIISTHSPTVMESANENDYLFHFQKKDGACTINKFYRNNEDARILRYVANDMGIIPGDALLSNCVIWVEGPSEILWLRSWLKAYLPIYIKEKQINFNLLEGLHYSILMTGGGLIANISFEEHTIDIEDIEDDYGLKVLKVNPNPFVIINSDNSSENSGKFKRCIRIAKELNEQNKTAGYYNSIDGEISKTNINLIGNLWLLKGRELENYCHPELVKNFYEQRAKQGKSKIKGIDGNTNWDVFSITEGAGKILEDRGIICVTEKSGAIIHKDALAKYVFQNFNEKHFEEEPMDFLKPNKEMVADLKYNLGKLFNYIRSANGLDR